MSGTSGISGVPGVETVRGLCHIGPQILTGRGRDGRGLPLWVCAARQLPGLPPGAALLGPVRGGEAAAHRGPGVRRHSAGCLPPVAMRRGVQMACTGWCVCVCCFVCAHVCACLRHMHGRIYVARMLYARLLHMCMLGCAVWHACARVILWHRCVTRVECVFFYIYRPYLCRRFSFFCFSFRHRFLA